jgi:hypothetical protein
MAAACCAITAFRASTLMLRRESQPEFKHAAVMQ